MTDREILVRFATALAYWELPEAKVVSALEDAKKPAWDEDDLSKMARHVDLIFPPEEVQTDPTDIVPSE